MANALTLTYDFTQPEVGGADDQWGDLLNNNWAKVDALLTSGFEGGTPTDIGKLKPSAMPTGAVATFTLTGANPALHFNETDQTDPAGRFRFLGANDTMQLQRALTAASWATADSVFIVRASPVKSIDISAVYPLKALGGAQVQGELVSYPLGNHLRLKTSSGATGTATIFCTDTNVFYILLTDSGAADGAFNALRPFYINKTTGLLSSANGQSFSGGALISGGLSFGSVVAADAQDLSKHLTLHAASGYGLCVTAGNLNYNAPTTAFHSFYRGTTLVAKTDVAGTAMTAPTSIVTQEKGDFRYLQQAGGDARYLQLTGGTLTGNLTGPDVVTGLLKVGTVRGDPAGGNLILQTTAGSGRPQFYVNGSYAARVDPVGTATIDGLTVMTREKGDARYADYTGSNTFAGANTFNGATTFAGSNTFSGAATFNSTANFATGIDITSAAATDPNNVESHIDLNAGLYGFCVSASRLNYNANVGAYHDFYIGGVYAARIDPAGVGMTSTRTIVTQEKGDDRYAQLAAPTFTGSVGATGNFTILHDGSAGFRLFNAAGTGERGNLFAGVNEIYLRNTVAGVTKAALQIGSSGDISPSTGRFAGDGSGLQSFNVGEVLLASISATGAVGSYALLRYISDTSPATANPGTGAAGSLLRYANTEGTGHATSPSGNWRLMGYITGTTIGGHRTSLWQRYS